ncbi:MAG: radical SAM protein [Candidatus Micrarchaeia archaeon]
MSFRKFLGIGLEAAKSNVTVLDKPYKLNFAITYWCNSRCVTCNIWKMPKPKNELTLQEIQNFAKKNNYFKWVELTGGEPFLRSDIAEIAKAFAENLNGLYVLTIPTNSLPNRDLILQKIGQILDLGIPRVVITLSLDGYAELHDRIRGISGNYAKVIALAESLHELQKSHKGFSFIFGYTISKYNVGMLQSTIAHVKQELPWATANMFHVNIGQVSDAYYNNSNADFVAKPEQIAGDIEYLISQRKISKDPVQIIEGAFLKGLVEFVKSGRQPISNRNLELSIFLDSVGNVFPSIMWNEILGNIRNTDYSLEPILQSEKAKEIRLLSSQGKEPIAWTSCDAYQAIAGNLKSLLF